SFYNFLFNRGKNPEHRIGYALQLAKHDVDIDNSNYFIILGDPATRLMIPRYGFSVAQLDTIYRLQKLDLSGSIHDDSNPVPYNGTLYIKARGPKIQKKYSTENNLRTITYTQPGNIFYFGELDISGNDFNAALVVPKDLSSVGEKPVIYFFATGQDREASGTLSGFSIGGLYNEAPDDREGPHIQLKFDGKNFNDGDYLSRQPTLQATITDPSGINICGNRGHNITLLMDKTEIVILSDRFKALNGFSMGIIEYSLPILSPGEHLLEMNVYDTYNNASKKQVTAYVVGTVTGDISIMNLLNYPNPMDENGTTFTFSLTDEARHANIKIYSQSGRLVDSIKFPAGYGFNQIPWSPPFKIANGVYFYKLTVRSVNGRTSSKIEKLVVMK
ncbi:MAG TPA: T9SS type A sorting domain-containing protein, partial [Anaerolineae bacterium]|nr:T9SS type A sorting domain-containing protein [Anaerolineae bacterium]